MRRMNWIFLIPAAIVVFALGINVYFVGPLVMGNFQARALRSNGQPATATILNLTSTNTLVNNEPLILVDVEVTPASGVPYRASFKQVISVASIDFFRRGNIIPVKYDPAHPDHVAFDPSPR